MKGKETKLIKECWQRLVHAFDSVSYSHHVERVLDLTMSESKAHDRFRHVGISGSINTRGISVTTEAKYFAIKIIREYLPEHVTQPPVVHYFSWQKSVYAAYAVAHDERTREHVLSWFAKHQTIIDEIVNWDYCDLISTEDRRYGNKSKEA